MPLKRLLSAEIDHPTVSLDSSPEAVRESLALAPYRRELSAVISPRYKLIRGSDGSEEMYDLLADPDETKRLELEDLGGSVVKSLHAFPER